jgi:hypothetical protein
MITCGRTFAYGRDDDTRSWPDVDMDVAAAVVKVLPEATAD